MAKKKRVIVSIADREYPLNILPEEEDNVKEIALKIETLIKQFEKNYAVKDKQDVLAMSTLQFASQLDKFSKDSDVEIEFTKEKLNALNALITQVI